MKANTLIVALISFFICSTYSNGAPYRRAVEGADNVKRKAYPKKKKIELDGKFGVVLNSSYVQTLVYNFGLTYFFSEEWGFQIEGNLATTSDKSERTCIESFINDPNISIGYECDPELNLLPDEQDKRATYGPAYVNIREMKMLFGGNLVWNPVYGKQIVLLSAVGHFDLYVSTGLGVALSEFYPLRETIKGSDKDARGKSYPVKKTGTTDRDPSEAGIDPALSTAELETLIGIGGRPDPLQQTNVVLQLAIGERFHFAKSFLLTLELKNYTLFAPGGADGFGIENFFTMMTGLGVRF